MIYDITKMAKEKKNFFLSFLVTLHQVVVISSNSSDSCYDINNNFKSWLNRGNYLEYLLNYFSIDTNIISISDDLNEKNNIFIKISFNCIHFAW